VKLPRAQATAKQFIELISPHCEWVAVGGSVRRQRNEVKDIEIIATPTPALLPFLDQLVQAGKLKKADYGGRTRWGQKYRGMVFMEAKCELFLCDRLNRGWIYYLRTGPANLNKMLMLKLARQAPFRFSGGYGWYQDRKLVIATEESFFDLLGIAYVPPHERTLKRYKELFGAVDHAWGNPQQYISRQKQATQSQSQGTLWCLERMQELEEAHVKNITKSKKTTALIQWGSEWLADNDLVYTYDGYGQWVARDQDHPATRYWQQHYTDYPDEFKNATGRLRTHLKAEQIRGTDHVT